MSTDTTFTITGPNDQLAALDLESLPYFDLEAIAWDLITTSEEIVGQHPETRLLVRRTVDLDQHVVHMSGNSKYQADGAREWALEFTREHPALVVTIHEDWDTRDADEAGTVENVFRGGAHVVEESKTNGMVPANLRQLLDRAQKLLGDFDGRRAAIGASCETEMERDLASALREFAEGLA